MDDYKTNNRLRAYKFSLEIILFCKSLPNKRIYWSIGDQLLRSGTSIAANVIEAKSSSSRKDFINFYSIALKSANETLYWLCVLRDTKLDDVDLLKVAQLISELKEILKMLGRSLITLKRRKNL